MLQQAKETILTPSTCTAMASLTTARTWPRSVCPSSTHYPSRQVRTNKWLDVVPGTMVTLYMNATGPGQWQLICHINEHVSKGMVTYYNIKDEECPR